jgi:hypothetical protein
MLKNEKEKKCNKKIQKKKIIIKKIKTKFDIKIIGA